MELLIISILFIITFFHDMFCFLFEKLGFLEIEKLEKEVV